MRDDNKTSVIANAYMDMLKDRFAPQEETADEIAETETTEQAHEDAEEPSTGESEESMETANENDSTVATDADGEESIFSQAELDAIKRFTEE